jgi:hypothetical protein
MPARYEARETTRNARNAVGERDRRRSLSGDHLEI